MGSSDAYLRNGSNGIIASIREIVRWEFYLEAAALLRLRGLAGAPTIRRIDPGRGVIEMEYIWGQDLRQAFADGKTEIDYECVFRTFSDLVASRDNEISRQVAELLTSVSRRGVIPRDVHAANFIRAWRSEKLYLVDFNLVYLRPVPGWRSHEKNLAWMLGNH
jgi:tRNA A-37 threonylcarbamoyl transferase component Bud32